MNPPDVRKRVDELYQQTKWDIQRALQRFGTPSHLVEDFTHEVFVALMHELQAPHDGADVTPFSNEVLERARKAHKKLRSGEYRISLAAPRDGDGAAPERADPPRQEVCVLIAEVFRELTPVEREVLRLIFFEGLNNKEVGARLGMTEDAVAGIKRRALERAADVVERRRKPRKHVVRIEPSAAGDPLTYRWSMCLGAGLYGGSTIVAHDGSLLAVGWSLGPGVFGGARLESRGSWPWNLWLVRIEPDKRVASATHLAGAADPHGQSIALDGDGHLVVAAYFAGAIKVAGDAPVVTSTPGRTSAFLTKIDPAQGRPVWGALIGLVGQRDPSLVIDAAGNIVVACLVREPGEADFILRLNRFDRDGHPLKHWEYLHSGEPSGWTVARAATGLLVTGAFDGTIDFGPGHRKDRRKHEFFLAKLDASGDCAWLQSYGGTRGQHGWSTCVDPRGAVFLAGYFEGTIDFGNEPLKSKGGCDLFLAKLHASGSHSWSARYPGTTAPLGLSLAIGAGGEVFVAGQLDPGASFGAGGVTEGGEDSLCLARFSPGGELRWCTVVGRAGEALFGGEIAVDASGGVLLSVYGLGPVTLGPRVHAEGGGETELYVVTFS